MKRILVVAALLCAAVSAHAAQNKVTILQATPGDPGTANLGTEDRVQGSDTVHEEVLVPAYSMTTAKVERVLTATSAAQSFFPVAVTCHSFTLRAGPTNAGPIWVKRQARCVGGGIPGTPCVVNGDCTGGGTCTGASTQARCVAGASPGGPCVLDSDCGSGGMCLGSTPLFAGDFQQMAPPNNGPTKERDCAAPTFIQGAGCSSNCLLYLTTN